MWHRGYSIRRDLPLRECHSISTGTVHFASPSSSPPRTVETRRRPTARRGPCAPGRCVARQGRLQPLHWSSGCRQLCGRGLHEPDRRRLALACRVSHVLLLPNPVETGASVLVGRYRAIRQADASLRLAGFQPLVCSGWSGWGWEVNEVACGTVMQCDASRQDSNAAAFFPPLFSSSLRQLRRR
jgi:hypothetical protein